MIKKSIFTLKCSSGIQGNKGWAAYLSLEAISEVDALTKGREEIETKTAEKGYDRENLTTHAFKPKNQKKAKKELGEFIYFDGDPRL